MTNTLTRIGIVGLGRLGKIHTRTLVEKLPNASVTAIFSPEEVALDFLGAVDKTFVYFSDYEAFLSSHLMDAIVICSPSSYHCQQLILAVAEGYPVFCEKPIGLDIDEVLAVKKQVDDTPNAFVMLGMMRRYDPSYRYAKELVDSGEIGAVTYMRSYSIDPANQLSDFIRFAKNHNSGGIFLDMGIHDIDLIRWFTQQEVEQVWCHELPSSVPVFDSLNESETAMGSLKLNNGIGASLLLGRNSLHGYHIETEIVGTKGMIRIGSVPEKNLVSVFTENGALRPCSQSFSERFELAYLEEIKLFIQAIQQGTPSPITVDDGLKSLKVAIACQTSMDENQLIILN